MARSAAPIILAALLLLAMAFPGTEALGINCRGSGLCGDGDDMFQISYAINNDIDLDREYVSGEQIACTFDNHICAFVQNYAGSVLGSQLGPLMTDLVNHGCKVCGSVPLDYPNTNDVSKGELTVNYVTTICNTPLGGILCL